MKAITKLFLVIFAAISCLGCEKIENDNNDNNKGQNTQEDFYYVRFDGEVDNGSAEVRYSLTGCGTFSSYIGIKPCSETLGPAKKGGIAKIDVLGGGMPTISIYVSKNNGPFALKKRGTYSLTYTIDF